MTPLSSTFFSPMESAAGAVTTQPRWVQTLSDIDPRYGGVSAVVPALATALAGSGVRPSIDAFCQPDEHYTPPGLGDIALDFWPSSRKQWLTRPSLQAHYQQSLRSADGIHIHGMWQQSSVAAGRAAIAQHKPYVVSAHGMLEPWALRNHRVRKQIYSLFIERSILRHAGCLHALTQAEAEAYRRYAGRRPVAIIPNGVTTPQTFSPQPFLDAFPQLAGKRIVLFLGRLHPKKGVDLLVQAWLDLAATHSDATLVIAGPDSEGMRSHLETLSATHRDSVVFTGMLDSTLKWSALAASECFVLPSHSEGLSMGVLEAMAAGKPVLLTPECNMPQVADHGAGWLVHAQVGELTEALRFVLARTPTQNAATGACGRSLIERDYTWTSVGRRMADLYHWLQGGPLPSTCEVML